MIGIVGGTVITSNGLVEEDVWVEGAVVAHLGKQPPSTPEIVIDADGMLVGPGFVDIHTHLREPGQTWKEDIASGTRSAAVGGYTAVTAMPNTDPACDRPEVVEWVRVAGSSAGNALVVVAGALTVGREGLTPSDLAALHASGVRIFTDDGDGVSDEAVMGALIEAIAALPDAVLAQHGENPEVSKGGQMHQGLVSERMGLPGISVEAETSMVGRDLALLDGSGAHYHVQHVSAAATVALIRDAKTRGLAVTAEVTPHHLVFDEGDVPLHGTNLKMYPPVRSASDREDLIGALRDGTIDCVATDHAPHTIEEKGHSFSDAPRGVLGLETAGAAVWETLTDPIAFFEVMSTRPAAIAGIPRHGKALAIGSPANLVVFDPHANWQVTGFASKSSNSPFLGRAMLGRPVLTMFEGVVTHRLELVS